MAEGGLLGVMLVLVLGTLAQTVSYRMRIPSILLLLTAGFLAGPVFGLLDPDKSLGDLLLPVVSVGVAVVLFEGGLRLDLTALKGQRRVVVRLVTVGVLITWAIGALALMWLLDFGRDAALLLAAILVVSGPTVVGPILRLVRPGRSVDAVLRWEGIVIDPVGALLAVAVFHAAFVQGSAGILEGLFVLTISFAIGTVVGIAAAGLFIFLESRYLVPDHLASATALTLVLAAFTGAEVLRAESGLVAVTLMGIVLANQKRVSVHHVLDFKESLSMILLGSLFIILAARVRLDDLARLDWGVVAFVAILVLVARPLAVLASTFGTGLRLRERLFIGAVAPRGIVAAAVASLFAIRLGETGNPEADLFVPVTFAVIVATVALYGLSARPLAVRLGVARPDPQGILFIGANIVTRSFATVLQEMGHRAVIVGNERDAITAARLDGLEAVRADVLSLHLTDDLDLAGIGRMWAMTPDDDVNSLASVHFQNQFTRAHCYQVASKHEDEVDRHEHLRGRVLFGPGLTYRRLRDRLTSGEWDIRRTPITEQFTLEDHQRRHGKDAVPLFLAGTTRLRVFTADHAPDVQAGHVLVALVRSDRTGPGEEEE